MSKENPTYDEQREEIQELKTQLTSLQEKEKNYEVTLNSIGDGIITIDVNGFIRFMNPMAETLTGWSKTKAVNKKFTEVFQIVNAQTRETVHNPPGKVFESGNIEWLAKNTLLISNNGTECQIADSAAPIRDKEENVAGVVLVFRDVSEYYRIEKALEESEAKHRSLVNNSNDAIYLLYNRKFEFINNKFEEMFGYTLEELNEPDFDFIQLVAPKSRDLIEDRLERLRKGENLENRYEFTALSKNGKELEVETSISYISYKGNIATQGIIRNITERKRAEEALRESEQKYKKLFYETPLGTFYYDKEGVITECNEKFVKILGSSKATLIGLNMIKDLDNNKLIEEVKSSLKKGEGYYEGDYTSVTGGKTITVRVFFKGMKNKEGRIYAGVGLVEDITKQRQAEEKLIKARDQAETTANKFRTLIEQSSEMLILHNETGQIIEVNQATANNTGYSREELYSMNIWDVDPDARELKEWKALSVNDPPVSFESRYKSKEGKIYPAEVVISKIVLKNEIYILGIMRDITERKKAEEQLIKAKEQAEESDRLKSAFLANMSHEIRTPMNAIIGFSKILKENEPPKEQQKEFLDIIVSRGNHLLQLINDILDVSKIEADQLQLDFQSHYLNDIMEELYNIYLNEIKHREKEHLTLKADKGLDRNSSYISIDHYRLRQIMDNLLNNAIKFTQEGTITFGYELQSENTLLFYVRDTGVGIPADQQNHIFDRFRQSEDLTNKLQEGTGLGLAISKKLVELMGGEMWVDSQEGAGSVFYFSLPYKTEPIKENKEQKEKRQEQSEEKGNTLLIVEDDPASLEYMEELLEPHGFTLIFGETGEEGYEAFINNPGIDLILLDLKLSDIGGLEIIRKIRSSTHNNDVPVIAQTAYALSGDAQKSIDAGCDDYISKPVDRNKLLEKIRKFI